MFERLGAVAIQGIRVAEVTGNDRLRALSFMCALMVVLIHCHSMVPWFAGEPSIGAVEAAAAFFGSYTFARVAVPVFFALTGFFLAKHCKESGWYRKALRKRFFSLYMPFVIWNALNVAIGCAAGQKIDIAAVFGYNPYVRLGCMQFWYLQSVFIYLLLSPLVFSILRHRAGAVLLVSGLALGWMGTFWYYLPLPLALCNYMWMVIGSLAGMHIDVVSDRISRFPVSLSRILLSIFMVCIFLKIGFGLIRCRLAFDVVDKVMIASGVASAFLNLKALDPVAKHCGNLLSLSFFVFAAHTLVLSVVLRGGMLFGLNGVWLYLVKTAGTVILTLCVGVVFRLIAPRAFRLLTGGRG